MHPPIFWRHAGISPQLPIPFGERLTSFLCRMQSPDHAFRERLGWQACAFGGERCLGSKRRQPRAGISEGSVSGANECGVSSNLYMTAVRQRPQVCAHLRLISRRQERRQQNHVGTAIVEHVQELVLRVDERQPRVSKITGALKGYRLLEIGLEGKHGRICRSQSRSKGRRHTELRARTPPAVPSEGNPANVRRSISY